MDTIDVTSKTILPNQQEDQGQQKMSVMIRDQGGAVGAALSLSELKSNLDFVRSVMRECMVEGQDYGKIPGCGDKPGLFQPGAQKLLMTFQLTDEVKEERIVDLGNHHREYSFVVRLTSRTGRQWDGVGTCSTLESKYRYRKAERKCPKCGKHTIIKGKEEFGGGWLCFAKKGGCGTKFEYADPAITSQNIGQVENENPADYWNTVRKMAFKRALVHASINSTNTSELWSQDLEDLPHGEPEDDAPPPKNTKKPSENAPGASGGGRTPTKGAGQAGSAKSAPAAGQSAPPDKTEPAKKTDPARVATETTRKWMLSELKAYEGNDTIADGENRQIVLEYFIAAGMLLPNETPEELPLRFVPVTRPQLAALAKAIAGFSAGDPVESRPFPPNPEAEDVAPPVKKKSAKEPEPPKKTEDSTKQQGRDPEWWRKVIVPIPHRGEKRTEYMKHPETIGQLYEARHGNDEESQASRQRLWGFINHYEPKGWTKNDGTEMPPSDTDIVFREALDACQEYHEANHPDEQL